MREAGLDPSALGAYHMVAAAGHAEIALSALLIGTFAHQLVHPDLFSRLAYAVYVQQAAELVMRRDLGLIGNDELDRFKIHMTTGGVSDEAVQAIMEDCGPVLDQAITTAARLHFIKPAGADGAHTPAQVEVITKLALVAVMAARESLQTINDHSIKAAGGQDVVTSWQQTLHPPKGSSNARTDGERDRPTAAEQPGGRADEAIGRPGRADGGAGGSHEPPPAGSSEQPGHAGPGSTPHPRADAE